MAQQQQQPQQQGGKGGRSPTFILGMAVIFVLLVMVALPTVILLLAGMMPSLVAWVIDRTQQKYATFCVGGLNFCGVFPYVLDLWSGAHTFGATLAILTDVFALVVMYGTAAFGWMMYNSIPPVIVSVLTVITQRRIAQLRTSQRRIIEEWGEEVAEGGSGIAPPAVGEGPPAKGPEPEQ